MTGLSLNGLAKIFFKTDLGGFVTGAVSTLMAVVWSDRSSKIG